MAAAHAIRGDWSVRDPASALKAAS